MADETVNITIGLTDELSGSLKNILRQFDEYHAAIRRHRDGTIGNLRVILREVEQVSAQFQQQQTRASGLSTTLRATLALARDSTIALGRATPALGLAMRTPRSIATTTARPLARLRGVGVAGAVAAGVLAVPAAIAAFAYGTYAVGRKISEIEQAKRNFRMRMGTENDAVLRRQQMILQSLGMSEQQARGTMTKRSDLGFDSGRGIQSNLYTALEKFGPGGVQSAQAVKRKVWDEGKGTIAGMETLIREIGKQSPTLQRFIWQALQFPAEIMMQHEKAAAQLPSLYERSTERQQNLERESLRMRQLTTNIGVAFDNMFQRIRDAFYEYLYPILNFALESILGLMHPRYWTPEMRQREIERQERIQRDPALRERVAPNDEWLRDLYREQGLDALRRRMQSGSSQQPQPSGTSYQPIVLRQIDQEQGKGNVTLVEIRDILGVIRNQQVNAGGGGPRVMLAGFGGGGGTGGWQAPGGGGGGSSGGT